MQLHQLKPAHKAKKAKRVGRSGRHGAYSGRGIKGQMARAGKKTQPVIRKFIKRYPKLRGYRFRSKVKNQKSKVVIMNLEVLEKKFEAGQIVNPEALLEKRIISRIESGTPQVKILGRGELKKALVVEGCLVSKQAKEKIEKAGGTIK